MFIQLEIWRPENGIANNFFPSFSQLDTNNAIFSDAYKEQNVRIYRRYIVYRETLTRYFVEKNRRGEKSLKIDKKSSIYRHQAINRRFNEKKRPKRKKIIEISAIFRPVNALQCSATVHSQKCLFFVPLKGFEPQTKGLGFSSSEHQGKLDLC